MGFAGARCGDMKDNKVFQCVVWGNTQLDADGLFFRLELSAPDWPRWSPGQFVMVRRQDSDTELTWARPFCISNSTDECLTIYYQVLGRGTRELSKLVEEERVLIWGPLGNKFAVEPDKPTLLLAGGMGLAPFVGYALRHPAPQNLSIEFAHRLPLGCYPFHELPAALRSAAHFESCIEDRNRFLALVEDRIKAIAGHGLAIACGPLPFLRVVKNISAKYNARTQLSLETRMACGVGACLGCVVKRQRPEDPEPLHVQTCTCGPNFWADQVMI